MSYLRRARCHPRPQKPTKKPELQVVEVNPKPSAIDDLLAKITGEHNEWDEIAEQIISKEEFLLSHEVIRAFMFHSNGLRPSEHLRGQVARAGVTSTSTVICETREGGRDFSQLAHHLITLTACLPCGFDGIRDFLENEYSNAGKCMPKVLASRIEKLVAKQTEHRLNRSLAQRATDGNAGNSNTNIAKLPTTQKPRPKKKSGKKRMSKEEFAKKYPNGVKHKHQSKKGLGKNK